jgi:peptide/nickel transport system substrate-binding protein
VNDSSQEELNTPSSTSVRSFFKIQPHKVLHVIDTLPLKKRIIFWGCFWVALLSLVISISLFNDRFLARVPTYGGSFSEGMIGRPAFVNPVLAGTDTDKTLEALVYSGLLRKLENGELISDLADSYAVSDDGKTYTVTLKKNLTFHDGKPVTTNDVLFTINKIKDPLFKSPERGGWEGVTATKVDDTKILFTLSEAYALFPENLTIGILPEHIWKDFTSVDFNNNTYNINAVGSGPYKIKSVKRGANGTIESFTLSSFSKFALGKPLINKITLSFYDDEEALVMAHTRGVVDAIGGISPARLTETQKQNLVEYPLGRVFAVFLNQNKKDFFADSTVREALLESIDRDAIIKDIFGGYGTVLDGPLPVGSRGAPQTVGTTTKKTKADVVLLLEKNGWAKNSEGIFQKKGKELSFSLATANIAELKSVSEHLKKEWALVGVRVEIKVYEIGDLNQEVIRPRDYDALLFGEAIGREPDLFAFWHSSQRFDPGLNVALYTNPKVDKLLSEARGTTNTKDRTALYETIYADIASDTPALFLYSPLYLYEKPEQIRNIKSFLITKSADRFANVHTWYINEDKVWKLISPQK